MIASKHRVLNGTTKFKTLCRRGTQIMGIMSRNETVVFNEMMAALGEFEEIIKDGVVPTIGRGGHRAGTLVTPATPRITGGTEAVATGTESVTVGTDEMNSSLLTKRQVTSSVIEGSDAPRPAAFTISMSAKSRGRPKVRKQQKVSEKKSRIPCGKQKATKLIQGTLAPVPSLSNLVKVLDEDYSYSDIKEPLQVLSERSLPQTKKAITGIFTP
ncbi:hypothetical protein L916_20885 [Phytophthora nicotianae]|uniref:Uncharacterized protein n=1 Tax=Phytophthora nicotianae TaxID=4792 RepID=W2HTS7_PHYNI|nr:hypothetical protein L916_20885 [Phytophthora nicotianae]